MTTPDRATERFVELVGGPEEDLPLDEAALLIAAHARPGLDVEVQLARLDGLAAGCRSASLSGLRHHLFEVLGFTGNLHRYNDPRNSFLDAVLDRRVGIPISLAVLTMEVGRRVGVPLEGVGMPGHFLVRHAGEPAVLLDPFGGGRALDRQDCHQLLRSVFGPTAVVDEAALASVGPRAILARMLANLRGLYLAAGDARAAGWVLRLRAAIPASRPGELADRAQAQAALAHFAEAAATLEVMAELVPAERAQRARHAAALLRARRN